MFVRDSLSLVEFEHMLLFIHMGLDSFLGSHMLMIEHFALGCLAVVFGFGYKLQSLLE